MADAAVERSKIEAFLQRIPERILANHSQLVAYFGYFLTEELAYADVTPKKVRACYDVAQIQGPVSISDTMKKSKAFVQTNNGTVLKREIRTKVQESLGPISANASDRPISSTAAGISGEKAKNIVVVHGRDLHLRNDMFQFLRSAGLNPIEWNEAVRRTGRGAPYTGEVVNALFQDAQAIVVILSPEEYVELRPDLSDDDDRDNSGWQPRPNVLVEAGMAINRDEARTILVQIGKIRLPSDLAGRNLVQLDGSSTHRHNLIERLRIAGCAVSTTGNDWLHTGDFKISFAFSKGK
jgi:predicted nucleotide-binding protein